MRTLKAMVVLASITLLLASCTSKARKSREAQEAIERMNRESQAQAIKQADASQQTLTTAPGQRADGIAARVNEDVILLSDLEEAGRDLFEKIQGNLSQSEAQARMREARRVVLDRLIEKKLLEQEAKKRGTQISDDAVNSAVEQYMVRNHLSKDQLQVELARMRLTLAQFKERMKQELEVYRMLDSQIRDHIHVGEKECRDYYESHLGDYGEPGRVRIQQIVLFTRGDIAHDKRAKQRQMEGYRAMILGGEDFGKVAREFSQGPNAAKGGDAGFFHKGELLEALDRAAFSMKVGEVSQVIETAVGLHLLKVTEREMAEVKRFEEVEPEIKDHLSQQAYQESLREWLDALKKAAYIDIRL